MHREDWYRSKLVYLKRFGVLAVIGLPFLGVAAYAEKGWDLIIGVIGVLLILPLLLWIYLMPVYHWKDRYLGERSKLWGALLVIETTGWFKIIYWLKHLLVDWTKGGRYQDID